MIPYSLLYDLTETLFIRLIRKWIHKVEIHEADEWIKLNRETIFNPHNNKEVTNAIKRNGVI